MGNGCSRCRSSLPPRLEDRRYGRARNGTQDGQSACMHSQSDLNVVEHRRQHGTVEPMKTFSIISLRSVSPVIHRTAALRTQYLVLISRDLDGISSLIPARISNVPKAVSVTLLVEVCNSHLAYCSLAPDLGASNVYPRRCPCAAENFR